MSPCALPTCNMLCMNSRMDAVAMQRAASLARAPGALLPVPRGTPLTTSLTDIGEAS